MRKNEYYLYLSQLLMIEMETATPAESARTEDPGLSKAREAAEVVPAESVRRNENQRFYERYFIENITTHPAVPKICRQYVEPL
ncbi:hypothetical protein [Paenisporosarcina quisquiliarum]|uniref:hypothetical protein n=1 Tax=Paenisporosarcina quisquiliarum TaxID=365346 RepID=UPI0037350BD0